MLDPGHGAVDELRDLRTHAGSTAYNIRQLE
jgi:hypothetical protein